MFIVRPFYASGSQAWRRDARADGQGGLLARGWYAHNKDGVLFGPATTSRKVRDLIAAARDAELDGGQV